MSARRHHWLRAAEDWRTVVALYLLWAGITCFTNLGAHGLMSMEGMVVDGARAMLDDGQWAVPRVYGELYTFKPALAYWLSAAAVSLPIAESEWLLRAPFALCGALLGLSVLVLVGRATAPRIGLWSGLAVTGSVLFLEKVRVAEFDIPLALGCGVAVAAAAVNLTRSRPGLPLWLLAYGGLALGFLSKGLPAVMVVGPGLLGAGIAVGRLRQLLAWRHLVSLTLFVGVALSYLGWAVETAGWAALDDPLAEARWRGAGWSLRAALRTLTKPLLVLAAFLPWSLTFLLGGRPWRRRDERGALWRAALGFLAGGTAAFMVVPTHQMRYYLPLVTAHAILAALALEEVVGRPLRRPVVASLRGLLVVAAALAALIAVGNESPGWPGLVLLLGILGWLGVARRTSRGSSAATLLVALSLVAATYQIGVQWPRRAETRDLSAQAAVLRSHLTAETVVHVPGPTDAAGKHASLYYYLGLPIRTFSAARPPPPGAVVLVPEPRPRSRVPEEARLDPAATVAGLTAEPAVTVPFSDGHFRLHRTPEGSAAGGRR